MNITVDCAAVQPHHVDAREEHCSSSDALCAQQARSYDRQHQTARTALCLYRHDQVCLGLQSKYVATSSLG